MIDIREQEMAAREQEAADAAEDRASIDRRMAALQRIVGLLVELPAHERERVILAAREVTVPSGDPFGGVYGAPMVPSIVRPRVR